MTSTAIVHHAIAVEEIRMPAGTPLRAACLCGWQSQIVGSRPAAAAAGEVHVAQMRPGTVTEDRPAKSSGPVECAPWCEYGDGHEYVMHVVDQRCYTAELHVELSLHPALEDNELDESGRWIATPDRVSVYATRSPLDDTHVWLMHEPADSRAEQWKLTTGEVGQLIEALQLVLGQIGATA